MTSGVYRIRNIDDGKVYIGSSKNIERRWIAHFRMLRAGRHHSFKLQRAFNLFGEKVFELTTIQIISGDSLIAAEQRYMDAYRACDQGYNVARMAGCPGRRLRLR